MITRLAEFESPPGDQPAGDAHGQFPRHRSRLLAASITILLVSITLLERFGLNFGAYSLNAALPAMYVVLLSAALTGTLSVSVPRLVVYLLCIATALASTMFNQDRSSGASLILLATMYFPFIFVLSSDCGLSQDIVIRKFLNIGLLCALAGIGQFYAQFVIHRDWLFDFTPYLPAFLRGPSGFNTVIPMGGLFKSNGFFFREPSGFSFIMALTLIGEYVTSRRYVRIACLAFALLLSYSGTGVLALITGLLIPLNRKTLIRLFLLSLAGLVLFFLLDDALNLSFTANRVNEFGSERSSGYIRYIAPGRLLAETLSSEAWSPWIGHGPGTILRTAAQFEFHDPTWAKLIYEYGMIGFVLFQILFIMTLRYSATPISIRAILFAGWLVMGGHLLSPEQNYLTLALAGMFPARKGPLANPARGRAVPPTSTRPKSLEPFALT